jgi:hypothetical protein
MKALREVSGDRIISSSSPGFNHCDSNLLGTVKHKVYGSNPNTIAELKTNISRDVCCISQELQCVNVIVYGGARNV